MIMPGQMEAEGEVTISAVNTLLALGLAEHRLAELQKVVDEWCIHHDIHNLSQLTLLKQQNAPCLQQLLESLVICETYFFRHPGQFEFLLEHILPRYQHSNRPLNVLSAGCATGEEAYSLALLLNAFMPANTWQVYGCDISQNNIAKARQAIYRPWSCRERKFAELLKENLFEKTGGLLQLSEQIQSSVQFFQCNLTEDFLSTPLFSTTRFDVIFCRNLMIYLTAENAESLSKHLVSLLNKDGWLIPGPSDPITYYCKHLSAYNSVDGLIFQHADNADRPQPSYLVNTISSTQAPGVSGKKVPVTTIFSTGTSAKQHRSGAARKRCDKHLSSTSETDALFILEDRVNTLLAKGAVESALSLIKHYLIKSPLSTDAYVLQALIYWHAQQLDEAVSSVDKALYIAPDQPVACYIKALLLLNRNMTIQAIRYLEAALNALNRQTTPFRLITQQFGTETAFRQAIEDHLTALVPDTKPIKRTS